MKNEQKINKYRELYNKYEDRIHKYSNFSQLTIDFVQDNESKFSEYEDENPKLAYIHISSMLYRLQNILEVIKEGVDKEFLSQMQNEFEEVDSVGNSHN